MVYIITTGILAALLAICGIGIRDRMKHPEVKEMSERPVVIEDLGTIEDFDDIDEQETVIGWESGVCTVIPVGKNRGRKVGDAE